MLVSETGRDRIREEKKNNEIKHKKTEMERREKERQR